MKRDDSHLSTADLAHSDAAADRETKSKAEAVLDRPDRDVHDPVARPMPRRETSAQDSSPGNARTPLFSEPDAQNLRHRWSDVQGGFVDEPRRAVEQADSLVAETMKQLAETFARERSALEHQWDRGSDVTTEDLRIVLQRYRSFFDRLLSI